MLYERKHCACAPNHTCCPSTTWLLDRALLLETHRVGISASKKLGGAIHIYSEGACAFKTHAFMHSMHSMHECCIFTLSGSLWNFPEHSCSGFPTCDQSCLPPVACALMHSCDSAHSSALAQSTDSQWLLRQNTYCSTVRHSSQRQRSCTAELEPAGDPFFLNRI